MKTFKQFLKANITPKMYDPKTDLPYIRTLPVRKDSVDKFRKGTGFNLPIPLAKIKDVNKKDYDSLQKKYNNEYKKFMNPTTPPTA